MLRDIFGQAMEAMRHNRRRTAITIIGMAWGIATVVLLLAYGAGFGRAFETIFAQFGTNMIGVFPGRTSEQAGGSKAGVQVRFQMDDVERIQETVPGIIHVSPVMWKQVPVQNDLHTYTWEVDGVTPELQDIQKMEVSEGRFITAADIAQRNHVAVIGSEAKTKLYSGMFPLGQKIRLNGISFEVDRRPQGQDAGGRRQHQPHRLHPLQHHGRPEGHQVHRRHLDELQRRPHCT